MRDDARTLPPTLVAKLSAARAVSPRRLPDPLEHLAWVESGAPFDEAGIAGFLDGVPREADGVGADSVAASLELLEGARGEPGDLYMKAAPRAQRHATGEYYTPAWLVDHVLDRSGYRAGERFVDPMCGAGAFLTAAIARLRRAEPDLPATEIVALIHGMDVSPAAVLMARAAYLLALRGCGGRPVAIPVTRADAVLSSRLDAADRYDVVAGNPPWVGWESLAPEYRAATMPLWRYHGLFPDGGAGMRAMLGRGKKDLAMLATYAAADRLLVDGGRLVFVIAHSALKSVGAGAGFRRFVLGDGTPLQVTAVDDFSARRVFPGAASRAAVISLVKGRPTRYPVPLAVWGRRGSAPEAGWAEPVDPADPTTAWLTGTRERLERVRRALGPSAYKARAGAYTGGANGVYWLKPLSGDAGDVGNFVNLSEAGRRAAASVETSLETELVFPLLRASEVRRFEARPSCFILVPQDPIRRRGIDEMLMASRYPRALAYLSGFRDVLAARKDRGTRSLVEAGAPFYSIFSVTADTMSPWKVVWPRIASCVAAAVVGPVGGRPVLPQETCTFVACRGEDAEREALYLAGLLNSTLFNEAAAAFAQQGGKSFGAPHLLRHIAVPRFEPGRPDHRALADLVRREGAALPQGPLDEAALAAWFGRAA